MEALTAVATAALTVYDMCKAVDKDMVIDQIRLVHKVGGKSGEYRRRRGRTVAVSGVARAAEGRAPWLSTLITRIAGRSSPLASSPSATRHPEASARTWAARLSAR